MGDTQQAGGLRRVPVDLAELADTLDEGSPGVAQYLDLETGEIVAITSEVRAELERLYESVEAAPPEEFGAAFARALAGAGLPAWMVDSVREADQVETGFGTRYIEVPSLEAHEQYRLMEAFAETVRSPALRDRLRRALGGGRGVFRRFRDALDRAPAEQERWYAFKRARLQEQALRWLATEGIEPA